MIDFFESKTFNAASVGALTAAVSYCSDMSTWATIGLALLAVGAFLLIFRNGRIELPMYPTVVAPRVDDGQSRTCILDLVAETGPIWTASATTQSRANPVSCRRWNSLQLPGALVGCDCIDAAPRFAIAARALASRAPAPPIPPFAMAIMVMALCRMIWIQLGR
jgi:hypothetical protein